MSYILNCIIKNVHNKYWVFLMFYMSCIEYFIFEELKNEWGFFKNQSWAMQFSSWICVETWIRWVGELYNYKKNHSFKYKYFFNVFYVRHPNISCEIYVMRIYWSSSWYSSYTSCTSFDIDGSVAPFPSNKKMERLEFNLSLSLEGKMQQVHQLLDEELDYF